VRTIPVDAEVPTIVREPAIPDTVVAESAPRPAIRAQSDDEDDDEPGWKLFKRPSKKTVKSNGTEFEQPAEAQTVPVRRAVRVAPAAPVPEPAPVPQAASVNAPAPVSAPAPVAEAGDPSSSGAPKRWVEKRGNRTITTTVVPVRKASAAKAEEKDDD
jgi:hypothetical protein